MESLTDLQSLVVRPIRGEERKTWDQLMATHHYLGFRCLVGESIRYVALLNGQWVALLGWSSAAYKSGPRDRWIGWDEDMRHKRLKFLANNSRFLILPGVRVKNLASRTLALNLKRLPGDWVSAYGHPVWLAETFIDRTRFAGTCCRAAGFIPLGQTRGGSKQRRILLYSRKDKDHFGPPFASRRRAMVNRSLFEPGPVVRE